jgi:hypothetical protein
VGWRASDLELGTASAAVALELGTASAVASDLELGAWVLTPERHQKKYSEKRRAESRALDGDS